jgi:hypothetical protein
LSRLEDAVDEFNKNKDAKVKMASGPYDRTVFIELPGSTWTVKWNDMDGVLELTPEKPSWEDFTGKMSEQMGKKKSKDVV